MNAISPELNKMSSNVSTLKGYWFNSAKNRLSRWCQRAWTLGPGTAAAYGIFKIVVSRVPTTINSPVFSFFKSMFQAGDAALMNDVGGIALSGGEIFLATLAATISAVALMVPIHFIRSICFSVKISGAAKGFVAAMDKIAKTEDPEERTKLYMQVVEMRSDLHGIKGPVFVARKKDILSPFQRFLKGVAAISAQPEDVKKGRVVKEAVIGGEEALELFDEIGGRKIVAALPAQPVKPSVDPASKRAVTEADLLGSGLNSPSAASRGEAVQVMMRGAMGDRQALEDAANALEILAAQREAGTNLPLSEAFPLPEKVLNALEEARKIAPSLHRKTLEAESLVMLSRGRDFLWGEAKREIRGLMSEKNLAPFLRRTLSSIDAEITRDNLNPNPNRAAFYRELFTTGDRLPVLEAMARRKGPAAESCQRLVSLFMVADRADGEVRLREKANLLRALAAVLPKGAELVYASTDVMASRLGVLGTAEGEEGCLATETRRVVEDEVRVAPKGRAGGGGGPVAGTATAAPAAGRSKSK